MSALITSREVRMPRRKGLMARALEQPDVDLQKNSATFDSAISLRKNVTVPAKLDSFSANKGNVEQASSLSGTNNFVQKKLKPTLTITFPEEDPSELANISSGVDPSDLANISSGVSSSTSGVPSPSAESTRKRRASRQNSSDVYLNPIDENHPVNEETLSSTQNLRSGFFRTIKKQYPTVAFENLGLSENPLDSKKEESTKSPRNLHCSQENATTLSSDNSSNSDRIEEELPFMSSMARRRLQELRKVDPNKVDVATGLQWIRLELHEMREQDKALFLQLIKLHSTIKEIRTEMKFIEENCDYPFDSFDGAASYWWPRCNGSSVLPDFSSSDGAHLLTRRNRPMVRREFAFNQSRSRAGIPSNLATMNSGSSRSFSSSMSSSQS